MNKTLYVGNLPWSTTEADLAQLFSTYAQVMSARIIQDRETGRSRGFGFVEVPEDTDIELLVGQLHGSEFNGRQLVVNEAQPRA